MMTRLVLRWSLGKVAEGRCVVAFANSLARRQRPRMSTMNATVQLLVLRCVVRTALVNGRLVKCLVRAEARPLRDRRGTVYWPLFSRLRRCRNPSESGGLVTGYVRPTQAAGAASRWLDFRAPALFADAAWRACWATLKPAAFACRTRPFVVNSDKSDATVGS